MKKLLKVGVFVFMAIFLLNSSALALDFQINKAKIRVKLPPGWSDGDAITVENKADEPIEIKVYINDWVYTDQDGAKNFMPPGTDPRSAADWIKFYPADFTLPAKGAQEVKYVVGVPPDAVGGHYAILFFEVLAGGAWDDAKGVMVKVYNRLGSLFYIEPEGAIERKAEVTDFKIQLLPEGYKVEAVFQNTGNVDITAKSTLDIIDAEGFVFSRASFPDIYTMPQDKANMSIADFSTNFSKGIYDAILTIDLDGEILVKEYQIEVSDTGSITDIKELKE
jgi:hypothetical protein